MTCGMNSNAKGNGAPNEVKTITVAQKTAPMFAYYIKTHVLLNADIISSVYILNHVI